jgi:hypothetical protein
MLMLMVILEVILVLRGAGKKKRKIHSIAQHSTEHDTNQVGRIG